MASVGKGGGQRVTVALIVEQLRLQHRLGQLFHKQRHPISFRHNLIENVLG
jgi:hypothetical protein